MASSHVFLFLPYLCKNIEIFVTTLKKMAQLMLIAKKKVRLVFEKLTNFSLLRLILLNFLDILRLTDKIEMIVIAERVIFIELD
ncbi:hypothetical protein MGA3_02700 [Bacillus methanolicus MGA3]|uniref:Uncharacterized protein n=1 Tax=Bacillus methanolicus (strain MGA3 / ATCC 53907) TaxID=796606 RepID=I3ECE0_BACMM|nr:hypothetical protein BMMGA3_13365 [Bacillus methanolicus MGA3]EIJ84161.1 hypothetical protein MGA3_02700 [Bacillus methanolicus MGA3]UQD53048.1 hypothetical protein C0971_14065 [Bacillus methanolicus]